MSMELYPDRSAWLASRREPGTYRIGASEVAAVLGLSPYTDPWDVWARWHLGLTEGDDSAKRRGQILEPLILSPLVGRGLWTPETAVYWHEETLWLRATPDGVWMSERDWSTNVDGDIAGLVEVKTDGKPGCLEAWPASCEVGEWTNDETPPIRPDYWLQVQAQLYCTGAPWCDLHALLLPPHGDPDHRVYRIRPSPRWPAILAAVSDWRERHLIGGDPPPARTREQAEAVTRWRYPAPTVQRQATEEEAVQIAAAIEGKATAKAAEERAAAALKALAESRGDAAVIYAPDIGRYTVTGKQVRVTPWRKS